MISHSKNYKKFVIICLSVFSVLLFTTVGINFIIDPYNIHQFFLSPYLNEKKGDLANHERLYKAVEIARKKPVSIQLGSSRVKLGVDPESITSVTHFETYDAAFNGADMEEIYHYFEHALYHQPQLKVVVIGLDFCGFNDKVPPKPGFLIERLKTSPIIWQDFMSSLCSKQALGSSLEVMKNNLWPSNDLVIDNKILINGELSFLKMTLRHDYKKYQNDDKKVELFRQLVETCRQHSIELKVFLCPMQAIYWEAIYRGHLWPQFEELKRRLSAIYPIWDFSGFNCVTEKTLEKELKQPLYFECSHFQPVVGKMIVEKIFEKSTFPSDFGFLLTSQTVEESLKKMEIQAHEWMENHENILPKIETAAEWK